jgi:hypothetical protein
LLDIHNSVLAAANGATNANASSSTGALCETVCYAFDLRVVMLLLIAEITTHSISISMK